jgi:hypothetical protein
LTCNAQASFRDRPSVPAREICGADHQGEPLDVAYTLVSAFMKISPTIGNHCVMTKASALAFIFVGFLAIGTVNGQTPTPKTHAHKVKRATLVATPTPTPTTARAVSSPTADKAPTETVTALPTPTASPTQTNNGNWVGGFLGWLIVGGLAIFIYKRTKGGSASAASPPPTPHEIEVQQDILQDLRSGIVPSRFNLRGYFPKNGESVIYAFNNAKYYHQQGHAHWVGGSQGVSFRIMKGVYYRVGAHRSHRVTTESMDDQGTGTLVVTNQAISFIGVKTCRVLFKHIVAFEWFSDGFGFQTDAARNAHYMFGGLQTSHIGFLQQVMGTVTKRDEFREARNVARIAVSNLEKICDELSANSSLNASEIRTLLDEKFGSSLGGVKDLMRNAAEVYSRDPELSPKINRILNTFSWSRSLEGSQNP